MLKNEKTNLITVFSVVITAILISIPLSVVYGYQIFTGLFMGLIVGTSSFLLTILSGYVLAFLAKKFAAKSFNKKGLSTVNFMFMGVRFGIAAVIFVSAGLLFMYFNAVNPYALLIGTGLPLTSFFLLQLGLLFKNTKNSKNPETEVS